MLRLHSFASFLLLFFFLLFEFACGLCVGEQHISHPSKHTVSSNCGLIGSKILFSGLTILKRYREGFDSTKATFKA